MQTFYEFIPVPIHMVLFQCGCTCSYSYFYSSVMSTPTTIHVFFTSTTMHYIASDSSILLLLMSLIRLLYDAPLTPRCSVLQLLLNPVGALQCTWIPYLYDSIAIAATTADDTVTTAMWHTNSWCIPVHPSACWTNCWCIVVHPSPSVFIVPAMAVVL